ncbi:MAG TPA: hypothetical protein VFZ59_17060 [Verrucomicrobiae bacterium]|nr:hypothetical protein [Verrucomicrobiae bacterium]
MKCSAGFLVVAFVAALLIVIFAVVPFAQQTKEPGITAVDREMSSFLRALESYQIVFDGPPLGTVSNVRQSLLGRNPRKMQFLSLTARSINANGEFVDVWGNPYQIGISRSNVSIQSAGPNGRFGDKDDIVSTGHD